MPRFLYPSQCKFSVDVEGRPASAAMLMVVEVLRKLREEQLCTLRYLGLVLTGGTPILHLKRMLAIQCYLLEKSRMEKTTAAMKLISLNIGLPREVMWHGRSVTTGIFKEPVEGRVALRKLNLDGDRQADLTAHGGEFKAVYCYPVGHYQYWRKELPGHELPTAIFGENFTVSDSTNDGRLEDSVHLGDRFSVGSAEVMVTQPRLPCYKLALRFQMDDMVKRFLASGRTGFYFAVTREGEVGTGDALKVMEHDPNGVPVSEITRLYIAKRYGDDDVNSLRRALRVAALPESWKGYFRERLERSGIAGDDGHAEVKG